MLSNMFRGIPFIKGPQFSLACRATNEATELRLNEEVPWMRP